jgi:ABC-type dipeptide/oligopeptide/nickel transport system permease component
MKRYIARRLLVALPTLLGLSFLIFALVSAAPGDPAEELARRLAGSQEPTPAEIAGARHELHLDKPFLVQYVTWLRGLVTGDLGISFSRKLPVAGLVRDRVGSTVELASAALALIVVFSIPFGLVAAIYHRRWPDHLLRVFSLLGASMPGFFFAYLLIIWLVTHLHLLPVAGRHGLSSLVMPAIVVAVGPTAVISRLIRSSLLEVFGEDYMRTARSKGLREVTVIVRHGLRNAAIPVLTLMGGLIGALLEGVVITEFIFAWPGLGSLTFESISQRDYPMIQAVVMLAGTVYVLVNLLVDISYTIVDPRVRLEGTLERV